MSVKRIGWLSIGLASALSASGCAHGEVRQVVRAQFAAELGCRDVQVRKRDIWYSYDSPDQFKVSGCGVLRTYSCPAYEGGKASYDEPACTWVAGDADAPKAAVMAPSDDDADPATGDAMDQADALSSPPAAAPQPSAAQKKKPSKASPKSSGVKATGGLKLGGGVKAGGSGKK
jgi:hypothetical protein